MIARARFVHPSIWWPDHPDRPPWGRPSFDVYERLAGTWAEIETDAMLISVCGGRFWCLTPDSKRAAEEILGIQFPTALVGTCEHAIEIGD